MTSRLRFLLIFAAFFTLLFFLNKIDKKKMKIQYSVFWILFGVFLLVMALIPGFPDMLSDWLGIYSTPNTVYLVIICLLTFKLFTTTLRLSQLSEQINILVAEFAIQKLQKEETEKDTVHDLSV